MTDTRFKWIAACATICVVSIAAMAFFTNGKSYASHSKKKALGEYVYIDPWENLHVDRKCTRLNYKGVSSERVKVENLGSDVFSGFCPKCVDDESYEVLVNKRNN